MQRVAIDFGTTGIRIATVEAGRIHWRASDVNPTLEGLAAELAPYSGRTGVELTLRCTNPAVRWSSADWDRWAAECGCRWFRVLGNSAEESVVLGLARQLATERREGRLAVIDVGASQASIAISGHHGRALAHECWRVGGDMHAIAGHCRAILRSVSDSQMEDTGHDTSAILSVGGVGGGGAQIAADIIDRWAGASLLSLDRPMVFPTVGILFANIVRTFEVSVSQHAGRDELMDAFLRLMDDAYDAITREGYDLDDAVCARHIVMRTEDRNHRAVIECGMNIDPVQLAQTFARRAWDQPSAPPGATVEMAAARVTATIEPVKPALIDNIVIGAP